MKNETEYNARLAIDLYNQGFSIKSVIRRVAKKVKKTQRDIKPLVEQDLFEYIYNKDLPKVNW
jgi:hypothetical protein